jgi:hypothetical protein
MCAKRTEEKETDQGIIQRGILLELLRDDRSRRWKRVELRGRLYDVKRSAFEKALAILEAQELVTLVGKEVWATVPALYIDELGMIGV